MQLLFRTWNHIIPLTVITNKTLKIGDVVEVRGQKYYVNCQPKTISPSGKKIRFYYCIRTTKDAEVTNTVNRWNRNFKTENGGIKYEAIRSICL